MITKNRFVTASLVLTTIALSCAYEGTSTAADAVKQQNINIDSASSVKKQNIENLTGPFLKKPIQLKQAIAKSSTVESLILLQGTTLTISTEPQDLAQLKTPQTMDLPQYFQWRKNRTSLVGETNETLTLTAVSNANVGSYTLLYSGAAEGETAPVHVSVYVPITNSTGGTVTAPTDDFLYQANSIPCADPSTKTFGRFHVYNLFDGPFCSPVSPDFPNPENHRKLTIDTCYAANGGIPLDSAIVVKQNTNGFPVRSCSDAIIPPFANNANLTRTLTTNLVNNQTYRATIYLRGAGALTNVVWSWRFHDDP